MIEICFLCKQNTLIFLRYDSTHVGLHRDENVTVSETDDGKLLINGNKITVFAEKDPKLIPWGSAGNINEPKCSFQNHFK